jgi:hypothetical protein
MSNHCLDRAFRFVTTTKTSEYWSDIWMVKECLTRIITEVRFGVYRLLTILHQSRFAKLSSSSF